MIKTVRLNHLRAALLAVAATGLLAAVGLVVLYVQPAEANYPGKPGKIAFAGYESNDSEIYTIKPNGGASTKSSTTLRPALILTGGVNSDSFLRRYQED